MGKEYYVYIMTNKSRTLYTGVTNNLMRRVDEHKKKLVPGFTSKYNLQFLVYYEATSSIHTAIEREKQIKGWLRTKKIALINSMNPGWKDLRRVVYLKHQYFTKCHSERSEESLLLSWILPAKVEMLHFVQHDNLFVIY